MRETIRRKPLVLLALLATVVMTSGCMSSDSKPTPSALVPTAVAVENEVVATIGKSSITRQQLIDQLLSSYGSQTLRSMMLLEAVNAEAAKLQIQVTDEELEQELHAMKQGYEDEEQFYRAMEEQLGMNREEVREDARYRLLLEKLSIQHITVTPAEIDEYFEQHAEEFKPRKQVQLAQIVVQTRELAEGLLTKLTEGEDFADLARAYSLDEFTAEEGGEVGWVEEHDPFEAQAILETAMDMQVGEITGPIETDQGYVILRLDGRSELQARSEEAIRMEIERQIALGRAVSTRELERSLLDKYGANVKETSFAGALTGDD